MSQPPPIDVPDTAGNGHPGDGTIDWASVRERLERLADATDGSRMTPAAKQGVLKKRAELLAQLAAPKDEESVTVQVLEFTLGSERYAVDTSSVREVYPLKEITAVPGAPPFILGVIGVRGRICSVVDLGHVFGLPSRELGPDAMAIVLSSRTMEFAILADEVAGMREISTAALQTSLPTLTGARQKFLRGVTPERVAVLDAQRLLADGGLVVREERGAAR
jgi:purine-binding chemotaxis protein CheW